MEADVKGGRVVVAYDSKATGPAAISSAVAGLGYLNSIADCESTEQYCRRTGRDAGTIGRAGCGGCCDLGKR